MAVYGFSCSYVSTASKVLLSGLATTCAIGSANADAYFSLTGDFVTAGDEFDVGLKFEKSIGSTQTLSFQTLANGGGTNAAGDVISAGGVDSVLTLFDNSVNPRGTNDDGNSGSGSFDSFLSWPGVAPNPDGVALNPNPLSAGSYTLSHTTYNNDETGPWALDIRTPNPGAVGTDGSIVLTGLTPTGTTTFGSLKFGTTAAVPNFATSGLKMVEFSSGTTAFTGNIVVAETGAGRLTITGGGVVSNSHGYIGDRAGSTGVATVTGAGSQWKNSGNLFVGNTGNGTLKVEAGGVVSNTVGVIGALTGSTGAATVTGAGSKWTNTGNLVVGDPGDGTLRVEAGGVVSNAIGYIGDKAGSKGEATVTGAGSQWKNSSDLSVGSTGNGTLNVEAGGVVSNTVGVIGFNTGSTGEAKVTGAGSQWKNSSDLIVGRAGNGKLNVESGGVVSNTIGGIGSFTGSTGEATVTGSGSEWKNSSSLAVGFAGDGKLNVEAGGVVSNTIGVIGYNTGSTGEATVSGAGSEWKNSGDLIVGFEGDGKLTVAGGGVVSNKKNGSIANRPGSTGVVKVSGAGSQWKNALDLRVGDFGDGKLKVEAGGVVSNTAGAIGSFTGSTGEATVTGAGSQWKNSTSLSVGDDGNGKLNVTDGGVVSNTVGRISGRVFATGEATVTGAGSRWNNSNNLIVGHRGKGTLKVEAGGVVSNFNGFISNFAGSSGEVTVTGSGSQWNNSSNLVVGTGTLNIADNGLVTVGGTTTLGANGVINLTGGRLEFGQTTFAEFGAINAVSGSMAGNLNHSAVTDVSTFTVLQNHPVDITDVTLTNSGTLFGEASLGNALINTTAGEVKVAASERMRFAGAKNTNAGEFNNFGGDLRFDQDVTNQADGFIGGSGQFIADSGWTNKGMMLFTGTADVLGDVNNTSGGQIVTSSGKTTTILNDLVHNGTEIRTDAGSSTVIAGAASGTGPYTGIGTVLFEGDLRPGNSAGVVDFAGDVVFGSQLNTQIELGGTALGEFDRLVIAGGLSLAGELLVELIDSHTLGLNQQYEIITAGTLAGTFNGLGDGDLVANLSGVDLFIDYDANSVTLFTIPEPATLVLLGLGALMVVPRRRTAASTSAGLRSETTIIRHRARAVRPGRGRRSARPRLQNW